MHPDAESHYHRSPLGVAVCDDCGTEWPCHLSAWGRPDRTSRCNRCGGVVQWDHDTVTVNDGADIDTVGVNESADIGTIVGDV